MEDATPRLDLVHVFDQITSLADRALTGESALGSVRRIAALAREILEAPSVAVVEFGPEVGRVVAGSGSAERAIGRRVDSGHPGLARLTAADRIVEFPSRDLPSEVIGMLAAPDDAEILIGQVRLSGRTVGALFAPLRPDPAYTRFRRQAMACLTAITERLYRDDAGLPLHADPSLRVPAETTVLVDSTGRVTWVNPRSSGLLAAHGMVVGARLRLPIPGPGQVTEHATADGRWLTISAARMADHTDLAISIRDVTEIRRWEQGRELFVALASHELRTPVTVIKGYADTLNDRWDALNDRGRRQAAEVLSARADELARLLDRLLTAVGDTAAPAITRFALRDAVAVALDGLTEPARERMRIAVPADLPPAFGEHASIAAVVSELVTNALKYAPADSGPIDVIGAADSDTVRLLVCDRGAGVRPEHIERAFDRYWQADTGDHRRYGGVGLGLFLVRRIVERQNGWVSLRPRIAGGTVAEVRLPRGDLTPVP